MTITTRDALIDALANNNSRIVVDKASIASQAAGNMVSLWRATGVPGQGSIPGAAVVCSNTLPGALGFTQQVAPATSYLAQFWSVNANLSAMGLEVRDRLAHMGGLSGVVTTAQTVGLDLSALGVSAERVGDGNYSDVQWFLEWYTATGATAVTATVAVTYDDASTGNIAISLAATRPASQMIPIVSAVSGLFIRGVTSVTLSATTGTAGSFGVTATRLRATVDQPVVNMPAVHDWARLGLPEIPNGACLMLNAYTSGTSTGAIRGGGKIVHG